jgi:hypothetical protein
MTHCTCDGCVFLESQLGLAALTWAERFVREAVEAVKLGVPAGKTIELNLNGPTAEDLAAGMMSARGKVYCTYEFDIIELARNVPAKVAPPPNFDALIEEYQDDPALLQTLKWMKKRYG